MKVLMVEPGYAPYEAELNGLREMQASVGGTITARAAAKIKPAST